MDKYTVDLDQVLNDFEYSELTDQYSNASRSTPGSTPSLNQNITKHSINNVFHSLNEYLNTNINTLDQVDNNLLLEVKEHHVDDADTVNLGQSNFKYEEKSINEPNFKTDTLLLDFHGKTVEDDSLSESEVKAASDVADPATANLVDKGVEVEEVAVEENTDHVDDKQIEAEENKEKTEVYINRDSDDLLALQTPVEEIPEFVAENVGNECVNKCDDIPNEQIEEFGDKAVQKIGFDDDLELDESEVMKLLEELEDEHLDFKGEVESHQANDIPENADSESVMDRNIGQEDDKQVEEIISLPNLKEDIKETESSVKENVVTDIVTETEDIVCRTEASDAFVLNSERTAAAEASETVESESEEPVIEESVESHTQMEATGNVDEAVSTTENLEEPKSESEETVETKTTVSGKEEVEIEDESSVDSVSRPQNLPLSGDGDQPKRKIDLIGDPGSTPYNNVYINKEIPKSKEKSYDSDTDFSTSSSPTFSDESSTISTISADEAHTDGATCTKESKPPKDVPQVSAVTTEESPNEIKNPEGTIENPASDLVDPASDSANLASEVAGEAPDNSSMEERIVSERAPQEVEDDTTREVVPSDNLDTQEAAASRIDNQGEVNVSAINVEKQWLGKEAPLWVPDSDAMSCLHCDMKFTVLKRRHHCRACGLVLCSKCCHLRFRLEYLDAEARVCNKCHDILNKDTNSTSSSEMSPEVGNSPSNRPNPNNPLEYCSTVSPLQQVAGSNPNPPAVMVPVGVLKRKGSNKGKSNKSVMFCDGIRPGSDLTNLDNDFDYNNTKSKKVEKVGGAPNKPKRNLPIVDPDTNTFIPSNENCLPPTVVVSKTEISYTDILNGPAIVETLKKEQLTFALHVNLYVHVRIISMSCCINKTAWCFSTEGLINVGQDEIVILLEYIDEESFVPKDVFYHINNVYNDAVKGTSVKEMGLSLHNASNFLDSKNHAGFVYIRPTFQCLENIIRPKEPYLIGILIHRWETPWAKLFPLRLILRLGAEYRYYPSPIISTRHRESVFVEIGHTIINLLADFRNFSYTLPQIRGLIIHMEDKNTTITIPANRYDQVIKSMSNSSDHILAFAGNFSQQADSHLVCIQDTQGNENCYSTHAINIHNQPRKVTGASFIVFNGALKSSSGLTAKSNIVEDGLMIQVLPEHMQQIRDNLRAMKNHTIPCGCVNAVSDETVNIVWGENDVNFNMGVVSAIDNTPLSGIPSIRVHNAKNHICANGSRIIRWSEVFIIQNGEDNPKNQDSVDISRVSEGIAKATCDALVKYLDLLIANNCQKIGIRTTLHVDNVSYLAGSNGSKLPPIYMKSLDDELIPVLHRITTNNLGEHPIVLELIFRILNS